MKGFSESGNHVVPALIKTIRIMEHFTGSEKYGWTVGELSDALHIPKSSVYRILNTLETVGILEKEEGGNRYYLGPTLARWAENYVPHSRYRELIRPYLEQLNRATKEAVQLAAMEGNRAVIIDKMDSAYLVRAVAWIGRRSPLHCSSLGKALLSMAPQPFIDEYLSARLEKITPLSVTDPKAIADMIQEVREKGYAMDKGELEEGLWCIGVPVWLDETVSLAISVSGPAQRMAKKRDYVIQLLREVQKEITKAFREQRGAASEKADKSWRLIRGQTGG
ncbi:IclR family transcriptional regulator [Kyrpidia tusciae]|uniref:Transcriptional regulator, IclR family n=1 Tax=Kyrpidia tusciae (strain DSM 2912 / NBRC 15312 / T2) TaxID=562970 RepID=D5WSJ0_KYRT2|nr:IclR family transcriptional regulator [Kyrpidia tusciae]ADG07009.1 transcriptional regulator, IclR family [Kyrpidia tusciae DSM 2912]